LKAHLEQLKPHDYFALLAYVEMNEAHSRSLQAAREAVRDAKQVATCLGFGPRFLHSTGQAYKGGPNSGVFLQVTCDDRDDLPVPDQKYSFGIVKAAQARGDLQCSTNVAGGRCGCIWERMLTTDCAGWEVRSKQYLSKLCDFVY